MTERIVHIYTMNDPNTNDVRYVGQSVDPQKRYREHLYCGESTGRRLRFWIARLARLGKAPTMNIVETVPASGADKAERAWIARYKHTRPGLLNGERGSAGSVAHRGKS